MRWMREDQEYLRQVPLSLDIIEASDVEPTWHRFHSKCLVAEDATDKRGVKALDSVPWDVYDRPCFGCKGAMIFKTVKNLSYIPKVLWHDVQQEWWKHCNAVCIDPWRSEIELLGTEARVMRLCVLKVYSNVSKI